MRRSKGVTSCRRGIVAAAVGLMTVASGGAFGQAAYRYVDLGAVLAPGSEARAINDLGQIVGIAGPNVAGSVREAWRWDAGAVTMLPSLGGTRAWANDINNAGEIVGGYTAPANGGVWGQGTSTNAVIWRNGQATALTQLGAYGWAQANGINDAGVVVGDHHARMDPFTYLRPHAAQWSASGTQSMLNDAGAEASQATAIDGRGNMVGTVNSWPGSSHSMFGLSTIWTPQPLALSPQIAYSAIANDINDRGQIVGYAGSTGWPNNGAAHLWENGVTTVLGNPLAESQALALNEHGQIVGFTGPSAFAARATIWQGADALDLNTLIDPAALEGGWYLSSAEDINESGWIVGVARLDADPTMTRAFLLTPVPEPSTWALLLLGSASIGLWRRRRRDQGGPG